MIPFDYDPTFAGTALITGWNPPYDVLHRVWGCKRPELLISETLAFHDRRTEDLPTDSSGIPGHTTTAPINPDPNFDTHFRPEGSLFVELYNPWTSQEPRPLELCNAVNGGRGLDEV